MGRVILGILRPIWLTGSGNIPGRMEDLMKATGKKIKCQAKALFFGQMAENSQVSIETTKRTDLVNTVGQMGRSILGNGRMANSMETVK